MHIPGPKTLNMFLGRDPRDQEPSFKLSITRPYDSIGGFLLRAHRCRKKLLGLRVAIVFDVEQHWIPRRVSEVFVGTQLLLSRAEEDVLDAVLARASVDTFVFLACHGYQFRLVRGGAEETVVCFATSIGRDSEPLALLVTTHAVYFLNHETAVDRVCFPAEVSFSCPLDVECAYAAYCTGPQLGRQARRLHIVQRCTKNRCPPPAPVFFDLEEVSSHASPVLVSLALPAEEASESKQEVKEESSSKEQEPPNPQPLPKPMVRRKYGGKRGLDNRTEPPRTRLRAAAEALPSPSLSRKRQRPVE